MTANQKYKESGTELSFKDWLKEQQEDGSLSDHETMLNADGEEDVIVEEEVVEPPITTTKKVKTSMGGWNMLGVVSLGVLLYGLSRAGKEQQK